MAFVGGFGVDVRAAGPRRVCVVRRVRPGGGTRVRMSATEEVGIASLNLTPELEKLVKSFQMFPEPKVRYQQLLHLAGTLPTMDAALKSPENKVPGCLSTVFVDATLNPENRTINFKGDSDAQLTKGLVALLVRGLSGCTAEQIEAVSPEFIKASGLTVSLTPGRNNGFLNMLATMKKKAATLASTEGSSGAESQVVPGKPICTSITRKLSILKPTELVVEDFSREHAGHAASGEESHIRIKIVSEAFSDLSLVKRHQVIYTLLADEMANHVHALQIDAKSPSE